MILSILFVQFTSLTVLSYNLSPGPLWSSSWPWTLNFILHAFLHQIIIIFSQHMPVPPQPILLQCQCYFIRGCLIEYQPCWGQGGNVSSAGWQVTLCDPMWHVSSRTGVAILRTAIHLLLTYLLSSTFDWTVLDWRTFANCLLDFDSLKRLD